MYADYLEIKKNFLSHSKPYKEGTKKYNKSQKILNLDSGGNRTLRDEYKQFLSLARMWQSGKKSMDELATSMGQTDFRAGSAFDKISSSLAKGLNEERLVRTTGFTNADIDVMKDFLTAYHVYRQHGHPSTLNHSALSHASMAGMPSNLRTPEKRAKEARKQAYKNYDRNTNGQMTRLILEEDRLAKAWASGKINDSEALGRLRDITSKGFVLGFNSTSGKKNPTAILDTLLRATKGGYNGYDNVLSEGDAERIRKFEARMATIAETGRKDIYRSVGSRAGMPSNIRR